MSSRCLSEEQLISLYYGEPESAEVKEHMSGCDACQQTFARLCRELSEIDMPVPDGGQRAVAEVIRLTGRQDVPGGQNDIMTIDEAAAWLKVSYHSLYSMLHQLPHCVIDGNVRFNRRLLEEFLFSSRAAGVIDGVDQPRQRLKVICGRKAV